MKRLALITFFNLFFIVGFGQVHSWGRSTGSTGNEYARAVYIDGAGGVYTVGSFSGTVDFDPGAGVSNMTATGTTDAYIQKLNSLGVFQFAKRIGGAGDAVAYGLAVDPNNLIYITGSFNGTVDADPNAGTSNLTSAGGNDAFLVRLTAAGNWSYSNRFGSTGEDVGLSVCANSGAFAVTGTFTNIVDFDPGAGVTNLGIVGVTQGFIARLTTGGSFTFASIPGISVNASQMDASGNIYTTGLATVSFLNNDAFVSKMGATGTNIWTKYLGGTTGDGGYGINIDASLNVFTTGYFSGTGDFDPGAGTANIVSGGSNDIFVSKLDMNGNYLWAAGFAGTGDDRGLSIDTDSDGNVYTSGYFRSTVDFDPGVGTTNLASAGSTDGFVSKLDMNGQIVWAHNIGSTGNDGILGVTIDPSKNIHFAGYFSGTVDVDPTASTSNLVSAGGTDKMVVKWAPCLIPTAPSNTTIVSDLLICGLSGSTTLSGSGTGTLGWYSAASGGTYLGSGSTYSTGVISSSTTYYLQDSSCVAGPRTAFTVNLIANPTDQVVSPINATICSGGSSTITINNTETDVFYSLVNNATDALILGPVIGTGSSLNFNPSGITSTTTYHVTAQKPNTINRTLILDGVNDYVNLGTGNRGITSTVTVSLRMKTSVTPTANQYVMSKYNGSAGITMYIDNQGKIAFYGRDGGVVRSSGLSTTIVTDNQWHEITGVVRSTGWEIYIDGVLENSGAYGLGTGITNASNFNIGVYSTSYSPIEVDKVAIWNTALSSAQILANVSTCLAGNESNLTGYFKFNESAGAIANDNSPTAINGVLTNMTSPACWNLGPFNECTESCETELSQLSTVTVEDLIAPIATIASLPDLNDACSVTSLTAPTATDNCAGTITGTHNATLPITMNTTVTWTYDDGNGNTTTQTQNVVLADATAPVADIASLSPVTSECAFTSLVAPTATDNCSGTVTGTHNAIFPIVASTSVTWTYTDGSGNSATQTQNIVIDDNTAPVADLTSLPILNAQCEVTTLTAPTATDNCAGIITGTHNATLPISTNTTITWTYNDGQGNTSTQTQNVVLNDNIAPIANNTSLANVLGECSVTSLTAPTATDNCEGTITGTHNASLPITTNLTITWTYNDGNGNTSTQTQQVVLDDVTAPVPTLASLPILNGQCEIPTLTAPTAADNCMGIITATHNAVLPITSNSTIVWSYDDGNGNISTQNQLIVLNDNTAPVPTLVSLPTINSQCEVSTLAVPTATDNCSGTLLGTHSSSLPISTSTTIVWTYTDGAGNNVTQNQNVVISDVTAPIANNVTLSDVLAQCEITTLTAPTATDNCEGIITGTHNATLPITTNTSVTWTYDDGNGNFSTQTQQVIINDNTAPVADAASLTTLTAQCEITTLVAPTATDNCEGLIIGTTSTSLPITSNATVIWSYNDGNGNISSQTQQVIIDDITVPVPTDATLVDLTTSCEITTLTAPTAMDNCSGILSGAANVTLPITTTSTITWTFDDGNGNTSTQTQNVIINDAIDPIPDLATLTAINSTCPLSILTAPTATDNCAGILTGISDAIFPITGTVLVTWTFTDDNGNAVTQTQNVVVNDNIDPIADVTTLSDLQSFCAITSLIAPTATDNCSGTISGTHTTTLPITSNTTITWTYTDVAGNSVTQDQDVIIDNILTSVTQVGITLTAENTSVTDYQWIDCGNGNQQISGANNQSFTPTSNGNYAVIVSQGTCSDTSDCFTINTVGVQELESTIILNVYPNPTFGEVIIECNQPIQNVLIYSLAGELVQTETKAMFTIKNLTPGIYILKVQTLEGNGMIRLVKE